jgi:hypothetical protein
MIVDKDSVFLKEFNKFKISMVNIYGYIVYKWI